MLYGADTLVREKCRLILTQGQRTTPSHPRLLPRKQLQVLGFPTHRGINAIAAARMIEEDPLFKRPGIHLPILAKMNSSLRESVRLAARVQSIHIGFILLCASPGVEYGSENETYN